MPQYTRLASPSAPFDILRRSMSDWLDRPVSTVRRAGAYPPVNLYETVGGYVLTAELPGIHAGEIEVSIEGSRVTLRGERKIEHPSDANVHRVERQGGRFRRTVELPLEVDAEKVEATHQHGVLMLHIPKAEAHQPRKITVQAG